MSRLDEIEARAAKATEGPWGWRTAPHPDKPMSKGEWMEGCVTGVAPHLYVTIVEADEALSGEEGYRVTCVTGDGLDSYKNADFIAHARADIPYLIAQVRERDAAIAAKCEKCQHEVVGSTGVTCGNLCPLYLYRKGE
jgi:hypothetical protein